MGTAISFSQSVQDTLGLCLLDHIYHHMHNDLILLLHIHSRKRRERTGILEPEHGANNNSLHFPLQQYGCLGQLFELKPYSCIGYHSLVSAGSISFLASLIRFFTPGMWLNCISTVSRNAADTCGR